MPIFAPPCLRRQPKTRKVVDADMTSQYCLSLVTIRKYGIISMLVNRVIIDIVGSLLIHAQTAVNTFNAPIIHPITHRYNVYLPTIIP